MPKLRTCPFVSTKFDEGLGLLHCIENQCAIWDYIAETCSIYAISMALTAIFEEIEKIRKKN